MSASRQHKKVTSPRLRAPLTASSAALSSAAATTTGRRPQCRACSATPSSFLYRPTPCTRCTDTQPYDSTAGWLRPLSFDCRDHAGLLRRATATRGLSAPSLTLLRGRPARAVRHKDGRLQKFPAATSGRSQPQPSRALPSPRSRGPRPRRRDKELSFFASLSDLDARRSCLVLSSSPQPVRPCAVCSSCRSKGRRVQERLDTFSFSRPALRRVLLLRGFVVYVGRVRRPSCLLACVTTILVEACSGPRAPLPRV